jgi:tRNA nucleotidyltransferase (CCA-adding enzyme)
MMAKARKDPAKRAISLYLTKLRTVNVLLTGDDLKKMGIPPGPRYKKILAGLLDAKLDGTVSTKEDELSYVKRAAGRT